MSRFVHSHQYSTEHFCIPSRYAPDPEAVPLTPQYIDTPSPSSSSLSDESNSTADSSKKDRIRRPPNCYMIFRKDVVAKKLIPKGAEHDSRHLSRIIGEMWNKLPEEEKRYYQQRAEEELTIIRDRTSVVCWNFRRRFGGSREENAPSPDDVETQTEAEPLKKKRVSRKTPISPLYAQPTMSGVQVWKTEAMPYQLDASIPSMNPHDGRHFFSAGASFDPLHLIHSEIPTNGFFDNQNPINEINYGLMMSSGLYDDPRATNASQFDPTYDYVNDYPCYP
ncbi:hypothetical protein EDD18DRAFT_1117369 [Armillaria luteobubalina]|uniref:HMG box domain-containing protein n=1 Tax=Armillaria luteobubalina TaxID=153913 RepID=A0AA39U8T0_9AGAR|nr:hypothetical protein EDD18DRAFT_1117369 [Armillaria luteobubalina]